MKKNIQFLSASDRLNYGDLLFPIITKSILSNESNIAFKNYALKKSNVSSFGALPTQGYRKLEMENEEISVVVIGGGHVLFSNWNVLYGHINRFYLKSQKFKVLRGIYRRMGIPRIPFTRSKTISPFAPYHLKGDLVYLSVGGIYNKHLNNNKITEMLTNAALLSVRDEVLFGQLVENSIKGYKVPVTVVLISKFFPKNELPDRISNQLDFDISQKHILVQLGLYKGPEDSERFIRDINLFKEKGYRVLCMPIGLAADHEDYKVLKELIKQDNSWLYYCLCL